jgi:hypothetical protein
MRASVTYLPDSPEDRRWITAYTVLEIPSAEALTMIMCLDGVSSHHPDASEEKGEKLEERRVETWEYQ